MKKILALSASALLIVGSGIALAVAPAQATTINTMYGIDNGGSPGSPLYTIDPTTGATTAVGAGISGLTNASSLAWAPDGTLKAVQYKSGNCEMWTIDPANGTGQWSWNLSGFSGTLRDCWGMTISMDGEAYIGVDKVSLPVEIMRVNLSTGQLIDEFTADAESSGSVDFIAIDPNTGLIYYQTDNLNNLYSYDPSTAQKTQLSFKVSAPSYTPFYGAAVGPNGEVYVSTWGAMGVMTNWAAFPTYSNLTGGSTSGNLAGIALQVDFAPPTPPTPDPTPTPDDNSLANTGIGSQSVALIGGAGLLAMIMGAGLLGIRRRSR